MNNHELEKECEQLRKNYAEALTESEKFAATEPLQPGVPVEGVHYDILKAAYDLVDQAKKELDAFKLQHPGIC